MNETMKLTKKEYSPFVEAYQELSGQQYRGRKVTAEFSDKITLHDTNWGGGSRNWYYFFDMNTSKGKTLVVPAPWMNAAEGETIELPENIICIMRSHFCGQDMGLRIYAHTSRMPKFLEAQNG